MNAALRARILRKSNKRASLRMTGGGRRKTITTKRKPLAEENRQAVFFIKYKIKVRLYALLYILKERWRVDRGKKYCLCI